MLSFFPKQNAEELLEVCLNVRNCIHFFSIARVTACIPVWPIHHFSPPGSLIFFFVFLSFVLWTRCVSSRHRHPTKSRVNKLHTPLSIYFIAKIILKKTCELDKVIETRPRLTRWVNAIPSHLIYLFFSKRCCVYLYPYVTFLINETDLIIEFNLRCFIQQHNYVYYECSWQALNNFLRSMRLIYPQCIEMKIIVRLNLTSNDA